MDTGQPLLCVAGTSPKIKVLDVKTGNLLKTLIGHGLDVTDLDVSPASPDLLASASYDHSVRVWSLEPAHEQRPCLLICAGEGHKEAVLTVAFHHSGRYLISGGMDCIINLWALPQLPDGNTGSDKTTVLHYPHFSTTSVHSNFVDCIEFYNDLIISKSAQEGKIVLWRIEGFSSSNPHPTPETAPSTHEFRETRSAFGGGYQRLLQFEAPQTDLFYLRFGFFNQPEKHPILAMGNEASKIFFWDLERLEEWSGNDHDARWATKKTKRPPGLLRESSTSTTASSARTGSNDGVVSQPVAWSDIPRDAKANKKYNISNPFNTIAPHLSVTVPKVMFAARQVAWSVGGEWMVVVGDNGMLGVFRRWE
ncbi:MAG: hypothetical protein M1827_003969 [Pycnora praestabilis]|nr:MAG: hypothetical protein M1827_003969 [Pycnora praestabilis]